MGNLYSITTNQAAILALFRVVNRYVGNLQPMPDVFPDYPTPLIRDTEAGVVTAPAHKRPSSPTSARALKGMQLRRGRPIQPSLH
jgi:hypothetical protein